MLLLIQLLLALLESCLSAPSGCTAGTLERWVAPRHAPRMYHGCDPLPVRCRRCLLWVPLAATKGDSCGISRKDRQVRLVVPHTAHKPAAVSRFEQRSTPQVDSPALGPTSSSSRKHAQSRTQRSASRFKTSPLPPTRVQTADSSHLICLPFTSAVSSSSRATVGDSTLSRVAVLFLMSSVGMSRLLPGRHSRRSLTPRRHTLIPRRRTLVRHRTQHTRSCRGQGRYVEWLFAAKVTH